MAENGSCKGKKIAEIFRDGKKSADVHSLYAANGGWAYKKPNWTEGKYRKSSVQEGLQKEIRRGNERNALWWASEMCLPLGSAEGYQGEAALWRRLMVIASEDVGLANPDACSQVRALYENWIDTHDSSDGARLLFLAQAVLLLVRSPKSRIVDHALITFFWGRAKLDHRELPRYAEKSHKKIPYRAKDGTIITFDVAFHLENETVSDQYRESAKALIAEEKGLTSTEFETGLCDSCCKCNWDIDDKTGKFSCPCKSEKKT